MPFGKAAGVRMTEEQAANHLACARHDRRCEIASDRQMPLWHPIMRRGFPITFVGQNIV